MYVNILFVIKLILFLFTYFIFLPWNPPTVFPYKSLFHKHGFSIRGIILEHIPRE